MPVEVALRAILAKPEKGGLGYKWWVSMEVFSWKLAEKNEMVPQRHPERGRRAWEEMRKRILAVNGSG